MRTILTILILVILVITTITKAETPAKQAMKEENIVTNKKEVVFAGGCFWCMQKPFDKLEGVLDTIVGYSGGEKDTATYSHVSSGKTKHREVIKVIYDASKVSFKTLLDIFWNNIDPLNDNGQFCDKGFQYTSAIYVSNENEKQLAEASKHGIEKKLATSVVTTIEASQPFYAAEEYHQDYYKKNPIRYRYYRFGCGRDRRLNELWDK